MGEFFYAGKSENESVQSIIKETASIIVVINGLAITAGSRWHFFARSGKSEPTSFAITIVANIARQIIAQTKYPFGS